MSAKLTLIKAARELHKKHNYSGPRLHEAIPYLNEFSKKQFVLKLGGSILDSKESNHLPFLIEDVVFLKKVGIKVILVHGGSRQLDDAMAEKGLKPTKNNGLRVTSLEVLHLAADVFAKISSEIADEIAKHGLKSIILGRESGFVKSTKKDVSFGLDYVGDPQDVNVALLNSLAEDVIPIVSSITAGTLPGDFGFNVNADDVAGTIASKIKAEKLILMTDTDGVLDENGHLLSSLTTSQVKELITNKVIKGGMIPKVNTCLKALEAGVHKCHIIKGDENSFIDEILTDKGVGTEFIKDELARQTAG